VDELMKKWKTSIWRRMKREYLVWCELIYIVECGWDDVGEDDKNSCTMFVCQHFTEHFTSLLLR
jgi:hypothetical protein